MDSKKNIASKAKTLLEDSPEDALLLYRELWDEYQKEFNSYDALFTLKALRKVDKPDLEFAYKIALNFRVEENIRGLFGWLIYDNCVKKQERANLVNNESRLNKFFDIVLQKNLRENDSFPCPYTLFIFSLANAYQENLFNAKKVNYWIEKLNEQLLSKKPKITDDKKRGESENASDLEKYYSLKTKALINLNQFEECKNLCIIALNEFTQFHYNNDLWFNMRLALCHEKLGEIEESEKIFKEILSTKAGSDKWFLYRDIAELYYEQMLYDKAWQYAVSAAFYGNEPHYMIKLYLLQARILFKLERSDDGKVFAQLVAAILNEKDWNNKPEYKKLFAFYDINFDAIGRIADYFQEAKKFLNYERYKDKSPQKGKLISVHRNGKKGRIKGDNGNTYDFHKKDFVKKQKNIDQLMGATLEFIVMVCADGSHVAENIKVLKLLDKPLNREVEGKVVSGKIKRIVEFGVFIQFQGLEDGLLHQSNLPVDLKKTYRDTFKVGQELQVKIDKVTEKGLQLTMVERAGKV